MKVWIVRNIDNKLYMCNKLPEICDTCHGIKNFTPGDYFELPSSWYSHITPKGGPKIFTLKTRETLANKLEKELKHPKNMFNIESKDEST